mmetsp:Transcript_2762/g.4291  ORF Transcript_2762/g.4291 Transcript_2762/m.4291 type:complete len:205 (-) Transcript_2762:548-1162(-)
MLLHLNYGLQILDYPEAKLISLRMFYSQVWKLQKRSKWTALSRSLSLPCPKMLTVSLTGSLLCVLLQLTGLLLLLEGFLFCRILKDSLCLLLKEILLRLLLLLICLISEKRNQCNATILPHITPAFPLAPPLASSRPLPPQTPPSHMNTLTLLLSPLVALLSPLAPLAQTLPPPPNPSPLAPSLPFLLCLLPLLIVPLSLPQNH